MNKGMWELFTLNFIKKSVKATQFVKTQTIEYTILAPFSLSGKGAFIKKWRDD